MEQVKDKYLQPILEILDNKNISGARLIRQDNRVMLLIDKSKLSQFNLSTINVMNLVYPNQIVCINDEKAPFDYDKLYEPKPQKRNRKERPYNAFEFSTTGKGEASEYYEQYQFAGIELDSTRLDAISQLGFFLEFVNAFQEQNPLEVEELKKQIGVEVYTAEQLRRYEHYKKQGQTDKKRIKLWVKYNEEIEEQDTILKLKDDPYFSRICIKIFNEKKNSEQKQVGVILSQERMLENVYKYIETKKQKRVNNNQISVNQGLLEEIETLIEK